MFRLQTNSAEVSVVHAAAVEGIVSETLALYDDLKVLSFDLIQSTELIVLFGNRKSLSCKELTRRLGRVWYEEYEERSQKPFSLV